ncbi:hypothetical protein [Fluviicola taffensis]|uniref:hypothetical protein n=1 Tax=Fluviicola taffensis TaxID=191579 RepID=UPI0031377D83
MIKFLPHIVLLISLTIGVPFSISAKNAEDGAKKGKKKELTTREKWNQIREEHGYKQSEKYKGPESDYYDSPTSINESVSTSSGSPNGTTKPYQGTPYSPKDLERGKGGKNGDGSGSGSIDEDPNIEPSESVDIPDFDAPKGPNLDAPNISTGFWKWLGIILLVVALAILIYYMIKNRSPRIKTIPFEALVEDLNPAEISKTELELRLEEATASGNYKECVRIYFLFAMKELIQRRWIFWKREKTNMHYIIEVQGRPIAREFEQIVSIYDLVWYGDYNIDSASYQVIEPQLKTAFQKIEKAK